MGPRRTIVRSGPRYKASHASEGFFYAKHLLERLWVKRDKCGRHCAAMVIQTWLWVRRVFIFNFAT